MKITKIALIACVAASLGFGGEGRIQDPFSRNDYEYKCLDCLINNPKKSECKELCDKSTQQPSQAEKNYKLVRPDEQRLDTKGHTITNQ